jgi:hypothetical protein
VEQSASRDGTDRPPAPFGYLLLVQFTNVQVRRHLAEAGVEVSRWTIRRILDDDLPFARTRGGHRRYTPEAVAQLITDLGLRPGPALQALLTARQTALQESQADQQVQSDQPGQPDRAEPGTDPALASADPPA